MHLTGLKQIFPNSLRSQLILGFSVSFSLLVSLFVFDTVSRQKEFLQKQNLEQAQNIANNFSVNAANYIMANNLGSLQGLADAYKNLPHLKYGMILSKEGLVLAHTDRNLTGLRLTDSISLQLKNSKDQQVLLNNKSQVDVATPIYNSIDKELIGWARVGLSQDFIADNLQSITTNGVFYVLVALAAGILIAFLVLIRLTRGIQKLVFAANKIIDGDLNWRVESFKTPELERLSNALNQMLNTISTNEKLMTRIVESMPVGIWILNEKGKIISCNTAGKNIWGGSKFVGMDEFEIYKGWFTNTGKAIAAHEWSASRTINSGETVLNEEIEIECFDEDKTHKTILNSSIPLHDANGKISGAIVINVDITEQTKISAELAEKERQLRLFVEHSPAALAMFDKNMNYIIASNQWIEGNNLQHVAIKGKSHYEIDAHIPERWKEIHQKALAGANLHAEEDHYQKADGSVAWIKWVVHPWFNAANEVGGIIIFYEEITEKKESDLKFQHLVEKSPIGAYIIQDEKFVYVNPRFAAIFGYKQDELIDTLPASTMINEEYLPVVTEKMKLRFDGRTDAVHYQVKGKTKAGKPVWVDINGTMTIFKGKTAIIGTLQDITESREYEDRIKKQESELRAFFENAEFAASLLDTEKRYVIFNKKFIEEHQRLTGRLPEPGMHVYDFFPPEVQRQRFEILDRVLTGRKEVIEVNHAVGDRLIYYRTCFGPVITEGRITGITTYSIDLTENKEAALAIQEAEQKFRNLVEQSAIGVHIIQDGKFVYVNSRYAEIFGYTVNELTNTINADELVNEEDRHIFRKNMELRLSGKSPFVKYVIRGRKKNGETIWIEAHGSTTTFRGHKALIGSYLDITERKKDELQLLKMHRDIGERVKELRCLYRTSELSNSTDKNMQEILQECVNLISASYQYPEITQARIVFGAEEFKTAGFRDSPWKQESFISINGKSSGKITVVYTQQKPAEQEGPFLQEERYLINSLAAMLGSAAERKMKERELIRINRLYQFSSAINEMMLRASTPAQIFKEACDIAVNQGQLRMAWVGVLNKIEQRIDPVAWAGHSEGYLSSINIRLNDEKLGKGPTGQAINSKKPYCCNDIANDPAMLPWRERAISRNYRSSISIPILYKDELLAVYTLYASEPFFFTEAETKLFKDLSDNIAFALAKIQIEALQKESDAALRESEEKFRRLAEETTVGVIIMQNERFIYVNPKFEEIVGYSEKELLEEMSFEQLVHEDDMETVKTNYLNRLKGNRPTERYNVRAIRSDGEMIIVELIASLINYGGQHAVIGSVIDITLQVEEEKRISQAVIQAQEKERLEISMELHDNVQQLMSASLMTADFIDHHIDEKDTARQNIADLKKFIREAITEIRRVSHQLAPVTDSVLPFHQKISDLVRSMNLDKKLQVSFSLDESETIIKSNVELAIYRVLQEHFTNVLKHAKANAVHITTRKNEDDLAISVKDDGIGFDPNSKTEGIGLENIRRRVQVLGGKMKIISAPGKGCELKVDVPLI